MTKKFIIEIPDFTEEEKRIISWILSDIKDEEEIGEIEVNNSHALVRDVDINKDCSFLLNVKIEWEGYDNYGFKSLFEGVKLTDLTHTSKVSLSSYARPLFVFLGMIEGEEQWQNNL